MGINFLLVLIVASLASGKNDLRSKIDPPALAQLQSKGHQVNVLVECDNTPGSTRAKMDAKMEEIADLVGSSNTREKEAGDILTELVNEAQGVALKALQEPVDLLTQLGGVEFEVFWRVNIIFIRGASLEQVLKIAVSNVVTFIRLPRVIPVPALTKAPSPPRPPPTGNNTVEIGLIDGRCGKIKCLGNDVVVAVIDTGAIWNHTELKDNWRGPDKYSWMDGVYPTTSPYPIDQGGHGTFTMGLVAGKNVGVAPASTWIVCAAYTQDTGDLAENGLLKCMEFMACPYLWNDRSVDKVTKNCSMRPQVINNSWSYCSPTRNVHPSADPFYKLVVHWNALGIISTFTIGNSGPSCASGCLPATFTMALAVGAVDSTITVASFSSRGPVLIAEDFAPNSTAKGTCDFGPPCPQTKKLCRVTKPDIVAPGVNVNSSHGPGTTDYFVGSGTSASAPLVAGVMALMICARPELQWNYTLAYKFLTETADTSWIDYTGDTSKLASYAKPSNILCNFFANDLCENKWPNNVYGWGLLWACKAVQAVKDLALS